MRTEARRPRLVVTTLLALGLVAASCGGDDDDEDTGAATTEADSGDTTAEGADTTSGSAAATTRPAGATTTTAGGDDDEELCTPDKAGGELTVGTGSPFTGMDPALVLGTGQVGGDYMSAVYDTLMRYDARTQEFEPNVAASLEPNADDTEWTLKLKPNIKFTNGDPMTTADVVAHIERLKVSRVRAAAMAANIVGMTVIDPLTMVFDVGEPWGTFPYVLATEPGWVPNNKLVTERGQGFHINPAGSGVGPYEVVRIAEGEEIVLKAKPDYWNGAPCIETLRFINVPGVQASYEAFSTGEMDAVFLSAVVQAAEAEDAGLLDFEVPVGALGYVLADQGITEAAKAAGSTPFQDIRVREAMQLAIDYKLINDRLFDGESETDSAIVPKSSPIYHGVEGPPTDVARARQLVTETKGDGTWDGSFTFLHATTPESTDQAVLLEGMWEAVGMTVTLEATPNVGTRVILERNFQVATNGFAVLDPAPWSTVNGLATGSPRQRTGFSNADMDAALKELRAAATIEETKDALATMQEVWNETFPLVVVSHSVWAMAAQENVHGIQYGPDATPYFNLAWVD